MSTSSSLRAPGSGLPKPRPAVFFDRDGTLNPPVIRDGKPYPPAKLQEFRLYPGAPEACRRLHVAGYVLVVATNQPDVGRGTQDQATVEAMHAQLRQWIPEITRIEVCYDSGQGTPTARRKPAPGMVLDAATALGLDLTRSWMIGDRWRDIECGRAAGVRTVFIDQGYHEAIRELPDFTVRDFTAAVDIILGQVVS